MFILCVGEHARFADWLPGIVRTQGVQLAGSDVFRRVRVLLQPFDVIAMLSHCKRALYKLSLDLRMIEKRSY